MKYRAFRRIGVDMRTHRAWLGLALVSLVLTACVHMPGAGPPFLLDPTGTLVHKPSQFEFPAEVAGFEREDTLRYDPSGLDVSVGYLDFRVPVVATVFVYPAHGRSLADEFAARRAEIAQIHRGSRTLALADTVITPARHPALTGTFLFDERFEGRVQPLRSRLVVARDASNFIEYRLSYPARLVVSGGQRVDSFLAAFAWPQQAPVLSRAGPVR